MDLHLELDGSRGRRVAIEQALRDGIREGRLVAGTPLPSTRVLAAELGFARGTVVDAYAQLEAEGYVRARQGAATVVAALPAVGLQSTPGKATPQSGPRIDLRPGEPDPLSFPGSAWTSAVRQAVASPAVGRLGYGDPRGRPELREAVAAHVARTRGVLADPERVVITSGYIHGLTLLGPALGDAGHATIAMEDPCLPFHREVVASAGASVVAAPVDAEGVEVDAIRRSGAAVAIVTPAHQYPLGATLSPARRASLVAWARAEGAFVLEDDYDGEFRFDRQPVGAVQGLDPGRVIYAGTTSKVLAPALGIGWLVLPPELVEPVVERKRHRETVSAIDQIALAYLLAAGRIDRHVRAMRSRYGRRRDQLLAALDRAAPTMPVLGVAAGLHAVVALPPGGPSEAELLALAASRSIAVHGLGPQWHGRPRLEGVVVGYSRPPAHQFPHALRTLARLLADVSR